MNILTDSMMMIQVKMPITDSIKMLQAKLSVDFIKILQSRCKLISCRKKCHSSYKFMVGREGQDAAQDKPDSSSSISSKSDTERTSVASGREVHKHNLWHTLSNTLVFSWHNHYYLVPKAWSQRSLVTKSWSAHTPNRFLLLIVPILWFMAA